MRQHVVTLVHILIMLITKKNFETHMEAQTGSAAFRSRALYMRDFEKNSKLFFALEKSQYNIKQ